MESCVAGYAGVLGVVPAPRSPGASPAQAGLISASEMLGLLLLGSPELLLWRAGGCRGGVVMPHVCVGVCCV